MAYQVLARKWRPRNFSQLVGQEHVSQSLIHALQHQRLHHAYLFTGTRGVGKTTVARILAKAINCENLKDFNPCGECAVCRDFDQGRFMDLIEVDAASRTKVEDTRDLLDNAQYAPNQGRYKVYLIDEVHMLSGHSFNALLKTLEEPPEHVKFLLATTDPHKIPVTVLSRCLQFNLKRLTPAQIEAQMRFILGEEALPFEDGALKLLSRAADGSMRDGLSLLDQAIAYSAGTLSAADVANMLGTVAQQPVEHLLYALAASDGNALLQQVADISQLTPDFAEILQAILRVLHRVALLQQLPDLVDDEFDHDFLTQLAQSLNPEDVQLFYQIALLGQKELELAPEPRHGFEMVLLRMLAFKPKTASDVSIAMPPSRTLAPQVAKPQPAAAAQSSPPTKPMAAIKAALQQSQSEPVLNTPKPVSPAPPVNAVEAMPDDVPPWVSEEIPAFVETASESHRPESAISTPEAIIPPAQVVEIALEPAAPPGPWMSAVEVTPDRELPSASVPRSAGGENWREMIASMGLGGMTRELANNCAFDSVDEVQCRLRVDAAYAYMPNSRAEENLQKALQTYYGKPLKLVISRQQVVEITPAYEIKQDLANRQQAAEDAIAADETVQAFKTYGNARVLSGSIEPIDAT
jgi:DNA polymerase-3 subunit gamma/tau